MTHQAVIIVVIINVAIHFPHGMGSCRTSDFSMMWFQFRIKLMGPLFSLFSVQDQDLLYRVLVYSWCDILLQILYVATPTTSLVKDKPLQVLGSLQHSSLQFIWEVMLFQFPTVQNLYCHNLGCPYLLI